MARGPKKHLKRINTPRSWLLSKMGGIYATRPNQGPHKLRECLPLCIIIKYLFIYVETDWDLLKRPAKLISFWWIRKLASKLTIEFERIINSPSVSWMWFQLWRQMSIIECCMMWKEDSPWSSWKKINPNISFWRSKRRLLVPTKFPTLWLTIQGLLDSLTPTST